MDGLTSALSKGDSTMRRAVSAVLAILTLVLLLQLPGGATNHGQPTDKSIRMARATWDTGWFQAEVYRLLLARLGYAVEGPTTMSNPEFYEAVTAGEVESVTHERRGFARALAG